MWRALVALVALAPHVRPRAPSQPDGEAAGAAELEAAGVPAWRELWQSSLEALRREPVINGTEETVVAQLGAAAFLHCSVRNLGERGVSWVRRRDWHIISSGVLMYTNDERFQVLHGEGSDDWLLHIKYVQKRDNGTYECQVSSGGGTLSRLVHLQVAVPEAFILGAEEYHVDAGSTINLVCIIEKSPVPPQYVFWYHNARMVNYDAARGVSVATAPGARTHSALTIRAAAHAHSGNYSCSAPNAEPAHIHVYVSEGSDKMAATLSRDACAAPTARPALVLCALLAHLAPSAHPAPVLCALLAHFAPSAHPALVLCALLAHLAPSAHPALVLCALLAHLAPSAHPALVLCALLAHLAPSAHPALVLCALLAHLAPSAHPALVLCALLAHLAPSAHPAPVLCALLAHFAPSAHPALVLCALLAHLAPSAHPALVLCALLAHLAPSAHPALVLCALLAHAARRMPMTFL